MATSLPDSVGQRIARGLFIGVVTLLFVLSLASSNPRAEEPAGTCDLQETVTKQLPDGAQVELLLAAGRTAPLDRRASYARMAREVLACIGEGTHIELLPITDSGIETAPAFSGTVPVRNQAGVPLDFVVRRRRFMSAANAAVNAVLDSKKPYAHSDILGTLQTAGEALHRSPTNSRLVVIVISNGWHQTQQIDTVRYIVDPAQHVDEVVASLRKDHTLPNLTGSVVIMSGFTPAVRNMHISNRQLVGLCRFWHTIIHASGATMPLPCEAILPRNDEANSTLRRLTELGLTQRTNPATPSGSLAAVELDSGSVPPGN